MEKILQTKQCKQCNASFDITDKDLEFYEKVSPTFNWKKYSIPTPTLCPECRQQRRLSFRNERKLYKGKCDLCNKNIISIFSPDKANNIYCSNCWFSDKWKLMLNSQNYNFKNLFFEQLKYLVTKQPHIWNNVVNWLNSNFNTFCQWINDCYLCSRVADSDNIYYSYLVYSKSINCIDCSFIENSENMYESLDCKKCFNIFYSISCINSSDIWFSLNCNNCHYCFACSNLSNKKYYIYNKKVSKEDYYKKMKNNTFKKWKIYINTFVKENSNTFCENCTWNNIKNSKDIYYWFDCSNFESGKYINWAINWKNQRDTDFNYFWENNLEEIWCGNSSNLFFSFAILNSNYIWFSINCHNSSNLFGCVWLKNKSYCILNKQYTKEEYNILVPKIIEHMKTTWEWGEFFPSSLSPFGYNETVANEYYPLEKEEAKGKWFNWSEYEAPAPKVDKIISADKLPDNIKDIPDDILNRAIECEITKKPFRIIAQELEFYRKHNLPIPRRHPDQRHLDRMALRNPRKLFDRKCDKCKIDMKTTYTTDRPEIVYCEECYNKEVY